MKTKPVQIHHIDNNNRNHGLTNLAVLCLDCHAQTQIRGGFQRKLDAEQVILYRDDWHAIVARDRATSEALSAAEAGKDDDVRLATTVAEVLREDKKHVSLAIHYDIWGNPELRDKYIEKAIAEGADAETEIFLRSLQRKASLVSRSKVNGEIKRLEQQQQWSQLGRVYNQLDRPQESLRNYCRSIIESLDEKNTFSAAYYLKEMCEEALHLRLFEAALKEQQRKRDLWWTMRCLQELDWHDEVKDLLIANRRQIERSADPYIKKELYDALGETDKYIQMEKEIAKLEK